MDASGVVAARVQRAHVRALVPEEALVAFALVPLPGVDALRVRGARTRRAGVRGHAAVAHAALVRRVRQDVLVASHADVLSSRVFG